MALILLDRNIVIDIEKSNAGLQVENIDIARKYDKKSNTISPLLSIIEGMKRGLQGPTDIYGQCQRESKALKNFYKFASTDSDFIEQNSDLISLLFPNDTREKVEGLYGFTASLKDLLCNRNKKSEARIRLHSILTLAHENHIGATDPMVMIGIACAYGNESARKVLKPRPHSSCNHGDSYNAIMDIRKLLEINYIKHLFPFPNANHSVIFATRDPGLKEAFQFMRFKKTSSSIFLDRQIIEREWDIENYIDHLPFVKYDTAEREYIKRSIINSQAFTHSKILQMPSLHNLSALRMNYPAHRRQLSKSGG